MDVRAVFEKFDQLKVLVIGDVMIDSYIWGSVDRISPEAPVPVVQVRKRETRLGGAANVALNIKALGATPILCAVVGDDADGEDFSNLLGERGITAKGIFRAVNRVTTVKHRILAGSQHILRVDTETDRTILPPETAQLLQFIKASIGSIDAIVFEDYDKGVLYPEIIAEVIALARANGIPTIVDPKKRNFLAYKGCSLFKPNLKELREGVKADFTVNDLPNIESATRQLKQKMDIDAALITLSENGVFATNFSKSVHIPAHKREIADVSGAGDTVVSVSALCMAAGLELADIAAIANLSGGLVCEHLGVVPIQKETLLKEALKLFK